MKKIWALALVFCTFGYVSGQDKKKHYLGAYYSYGACIYNYTTSSLFPSNQYKGKNYYGFGLDYKYQGKENYELCLGLGMTSNNIDVIHRKYFEPESGPYDDIFFIVSLPVLLRFHFLKYLFAGGGPCLNHHSVGSQWGLGIVVIAGAEYMFKSGLTVSLSPKWQWNWIDVFKDKRSFDNNNFGEFMEKMSQLGFSIGVGYKFGK